METEQAVINIMKATELFTDEEIKAAKVYVHTYHLNPYVYPGVCAIGFSPNKTGELVGIEGKILQQKCRNHQIKAYQDYQGWWTIPVDEVVRLKAEQNAKKD